MIYTALVRNGKIEPEHPVYYFEEIHKLNGKEVSVEIKEVSIRSTPQNRYYWGVVVYMVRERLLELGYELNDLNQDEHAPKNITRDDVHLFLKDHFNRKDLLHPETGEVLGSFSASTTDVTPKEFALYIERIIRWASQALDITIPPPTKK